MSLLRSAGMPDRPAAASHPLLGRYTIERELGRGGMATVYLAEDRQLSRRVALKLLHPELGATLGSERFQREIALVARLSHPNILALYDSGAADGRLFYVMPYVQGESLRQRLEREGPLPVSEAVRIVGAVAAALDHAHEAGIVHRDVKPENILLAGDAGGGPPRPLVTDFGIAKALDGVGERLTETGLSLGTPTYMSPEQAAAGGRLDRRSDIYALGCVAYEMLAGQPPFTGPTAQAVMARHAVDPVPPLRTVRPGVPVGVAEAIERALAKVPVDRFATAGEFVEALAAEHPGRPRVRRLLPGRAIVLLAAGASLTAAAFGFWRLREPSGPPVVTSAARIAVLPFFPATQDTALVRLGRDLAVTISASLDGVGGIETADRLSVATETAERRSLSAAEAATVARRLGASSLLRGTLVRAGDLVRLDLGLYGTEGLAPLAEGISVSAHRDSIGALTDSATWSLLRQVWRRGTPPSPSLTAVTTRSLPALRAFLEGERELAASRWIEASLAFRSAIAADSAFGLAYFRYALAESWEHQPVEPRVLEALRRHGENFPERERLLTDAFLVPGASLSLKIERYRAVTRRFPDYWPGWFLYADVLAHNGAAAGIDWSEGREALQRVVELNPELKPAWGHYFYYTLGRRPDEAARALARVMELGPDPPDKPGLTLQTRLLLGVSRAGGRIPPELDKMADSLVSIRAGYTNPYAAQVIVPLLFLNSGFPAAQQELNRRMLGSGRASQQVVTLIRASDAWAWATRGRWDSALATMAELAAAHPGPIGRDIQPEFPVASPVLAIESYGLAVLGAWLGTTATEAADERRTEAVAVIAELGDIKDQQDARGRIAWLDGLLGSARGDRSAIRVARRDAAQSGYSRADLVDRSLAAFDLALAGDRERAGRELASLEEHCLNDEACNGFTPHYAVHRLAAGGWLGEAGNVEAARRLLRVWAGGAGVPSDAWWFISSAALSGPAYLARARLEETHGPPGLAREYYQLFLRVYDQPMPSHAHLIDEAKAALNRLHAAR